MQQYCKDLNLSPGPDITYKHINRFIEEACAAA